MMTYFRTSLLDDALACEGSDAVFDILARVNEIGGLLVDLLT